MKFPFPVDFAAAFVFEPRAANWPYLRDAFASNGVQLELQHSRQADEDGQMPPELPNTTPYRAWRRSPHAYSFWRKQARLIESLPAAVEHLLLVEDDCVLMPNFSEVCAAAAEQLAGQPYAAIYLGYQVLQRSTLKSLGQNLARVYDVVGFHCVLLRREVFARLLALGPIGPMDDSMCRFIHRDHRCLAVTPSVAKQRSGWSYVEQRHNERKGV